MSEHPSHHRHHALRLSFVVAVLTMLAPFTIDTYLPSFPDIGAALGASHVQLQQTLSLYLLAFAATTLVYGPLSDALGRRPVVIGALVLYVLSSVACAVAGSIHALIIARIGQGLSASAGVVIGRAMVRDSYGGHQAQRVMANVMLFFSVAPAVAPVIGGLLHDLAGWRSVFWFLALLGGACALLVWLRTRETLDPAARHAVDVRRMLHAYGRALRHGRFMALVIVFALNFGGFFIYISGAPVLLYEHLQLGPRDFWVLFVPMVGGIMLGALLAGRLAGRLPLAHGVAIGFVLMVGAGLGNVLQAWALAPEAVAVVTPLAFYALGAAFCMPMLSLMALDCFPHARGMASAMLAFVQMAFGALIAGVVVPLIIHDLLLTAATMLGLCLTALVLWWAVGGACVAERSAAAP